MNAHKKHIYVLIVDDIVILRQGLKAVLEQDEEIQVIGMASNGEEAVKQCKRFQPDVVLMDMHMPEYDGAYGTKAIKSQFPNVKVLVLTTFDDDETINAAMNSGADGYILKEMADDKVIQSVKSVYSGINVFGSSVYQNIQTRMQMTASSDLPVEQIAKEKFGLTERELDVIRCVAGGLDNKEIAAALFLAEGTVRNNISRLLDKLKLKDRTQLAVFAVKNNLHI